MTARECFCGHYESEHQDPRLGLPRRCRARHADEMGIYETCDCPGYEPEENPDA